MPTLERILLFITNKINYKNDNKANLTKKNSKYNKMLLNKQINIC